MSEKPKILVADDSPQLREFYQMLLRRLDCQPVAVESGDQALKFLQHAAEPFALIILDLLMPGRSGWDTLMDIRNLPEYRQIPIIVITGMELPEEQTRRLEPYCQKILTKANFSIATIKQILEELLGRQAQ